MANLIYIPAIREKIPGLVSVASLQIEYPLKDQDLNESLKAAVNETLSRPLSDMSIRPRPAPRRAPYGPEIDCFFLVSSDVDLLVGRIHEISNIYDTGAKSDRKQRIANGPLVSCTPEEKLKYGYPKV